MRKSKKLLAFALAAAMVMGISAPAFADDPAAPAVVSDEGRIDTVSVNGTNQTGSLAAATGKITITNTKVGETYSIYRIFELASFKDANVASGQHDDEAYSYVISSASPWYSWLISQGYAKVKTSSAELGDKQLFWIEESAVTINGTNTYHIITATSRFSNEYDVSTDEYPYDDTDYTAAGVKVVQEFAQAALAYAEATSGITAEGVEVAVSKEGAADDGADIVFSGKTLGYYVMGTTMGTLCALDTTNKDVTVYEKNQEATIEKKVKAKDSSAARDENGRYADGEEVWLEDTDHEIGDTVYFMTTIKTRQGAENYVLHDVMEKGLTVDKTATDGKHGNYKLYWFEADQDANTPGALHKILVEGTDYTISFPGADGDGCDFEIEFKKTFLDTVKDNETIEVEYQAMLNEDAFIHGDTEAASSTTNISGHLDADVEEIHADSNTDNKNTNSSILTFGASSSTDWNTATVQTYQFDIIKTKNADGTVFDTLDNAVFNIYGAKADGVTMADAPLAFMETKDAENNTVPGSYRLPDATETAAITDIVSSLQNPINLRGLEAGTYWIVETSAPNGYNKLSSPIKVVIAHDTTDGSLKSDIITISSEGNVELSSGSQPVNWDGKITVSDGVNKYDLTAVEGEEPENGGVHIINNTGVELPSTGGIGTTIFYIMGSILVVGAGLILVAKRRMNLV